MANAIEELARRSGLTPQQAYQQLAAMNPRDLQQAMGNAGISQGALLEFVNSVTGGTATIQDVETYLNSGPQATVRPTNTTNGQWTTHQAPAPRPVTVESVMGNAQRGAEASNTAMVEAGTANTQGTTQGQANAPENSAQWWMGQGDKLREWGIDPAALQSLPAGARFDLNDPITRNRIQILSGISSGSGGIDAAIMASPQFTSGYGPGDFRPDMITDEMRNQYVASMLNSRGGNWLSDLVGTIVTMGTAGIIAYGALGPLLSSAFAGATPAEVSGASSYLGDMFAGMSAEEITAMMTPELASTLSGAGVSATTLGLTGTAATTFSSLVHTAGDVVDTVGDTVGDVVDTVTDNDLLGGIIAALPALSGLFNYTATREGYEAQQEGINQAIGEVQTGRENAQNFLLAGGVMAREDITNAGTRADTAVTQARDATLAEQTAMLEGSNAQLSPYMTAGAEGVNALRERTLAGPGEFTESPGYQFRLNEGVNALDRSASSRGLLRSGAQDRAVTRYGQDYASNEYQNFLDQYNTSLGQLTNLSNIGLNATNQSTNLASQYAGRMQNARELAGSTLSDNALRVGGANAGIATQTGTNLAETEMRAGETIANARVGAGTSRGAGYIAGANALTNGVQQGTENYLNWRRTQNGAVR